MKALAAVVLAIRVLLILAQPFAIGKERAPYHPLDAALDTVLGVLICILCARILGWL